AAEEWTLTIKGHQKEKVAAELVAGLYDASLDALIPHAWNWSKLFGNNTQYIYWNNFGFKSSSQEAGQQGTSHEGIEKEYPSWTLPLEFGGYNRYYNGGRMYKSSMRGNVAMEEGEAEIEIMDPITGEARIERSMAAPAADEKAAGLAAPEVKKSGE